MCTRTLWEWISIRDPETNALSGGDHPSLAIYPRASNEYLIWLECQKKHQDFCVPETYCTMHMLAKILRGRYGVAYDRAYRCQAVSNHNVRNEALVGRKKNKKIKKKNKKN